ncbi:uncharacterized protein G2W53_004018 [Senna tora]|uniref:Uncharacterized protein n=1 Tax=Senna tora TaxID=362788 RepID=A0A834XB24_9FABA|nr:uncharacterized protein G2W53_004018 [Senna tora]
MDYMNNDTQYSATGTPRRLKLQEMFAWKVGQGEGSSFSAPRVVCLCRLHEYVYSLLVWVRKVLYSYDDSLRPRECIWTGMIQRILLICETKVRRHGRNLPVNHEPNLVKEKSSCGVGPGFVSGYASRRRAVPAMWPGWVMDEWAQAIAPQ